MGDIGDSHIYHRPIDQIGFILNKELETKYTIFIEQGKIDQELY